MNPGRGLIVGVAKLSKSILGKLFYYKYAYLYWICMPFALGLISNYFTPDSIRKGGEGARHEVIFLFLYLAPAAFYFLIKNLKPIKLSYLLLLAFPLAYILRLYLASLGGNFDLKSYNTVADIVLSGKSVYANTSHYNYTPLWSYILAACKYIALFFNNTPQVFHYLIVTILFVAETYIGYHLYKKYKDAYITLFFIFNPIAIVISGYHSQFEILAIAMAFAAVLQLNKNNVIKAALLLGVSLIIKHIMVFFALFLLFDKSLSVKNKIILTLLPVALFLITFIPFWRDLEAIKENVFNYRSAFNSGIFTQLLHLMVPDQLVNLTLFKWIPVFTDWMFVWLLSMLGMGYIVNRYCKQYVFEMYLMVMVFTSISMTDQYLSIPIMALAVFYRYYASWVYIFLGGFYLIFVSTNNLGPQGWIKKISINSTFDKLHYNYPNIQIWLLVLIIVIIIKEIRKLKRESEIPEKE